MKRSYLVNISLIMLFALLINVKAQEILFDINPSGDDNVDLIALFNGKILFSADDGIHGAELWEFDPNTQEVRMIADIYEGSLGSYPGVGTIQQYKSIIIQDRIYFGAKTILGNELCYYDGENVSIIDINKSPTEEENSFYDARPGYMYNYKDTLIVGVEEAYRPNGKYESTSYRGYYMIGKDNTYKKFHSTGYPLLVDDNNVYLQYSEGEGRWHKTLKYDGFNFSTLMDSSKNAHSFIKLLGQNLIGIRNQTFSPLFNYEHLFNGDLFSTNLNDILIELEADINFIVFNEESKYPIVYKSPNKLYHSNIAYLEYDKIKDEFYISNSYDNVYQTPFETGYIYLEEYNYFMPHVYYGLAIKDNIFLKTKNSSVVLKDKSLLYYSDELNNFVKYKIPEYNIEYRESDEGLYLKWKINTESYQDVSKINIFYSKLNEGLVNYDSVSVSTPSIMDSLLFTDIEFGIEYEFYMNMVLNDDFTFLESDKIKVIYNDIFPPILSIIISAQFDDANKNVKIKWHKSNSTDLNHYNVYRKSNLSDAIHLATVDKNDTTYSDDQISSNSTYSYWITAIDTLGNESQPTDTISITPNLVAYKLGSIFSRIDSLVKVPVILSGGDFSVGGLQFAIHYQGTHLSNSSDRLKNGRAKLLSGKINISDISFNQIDTTMYFSWAGLETSVQDGDTLFSLQFRVGEEAPVFTPLRIEESSDLEPAFITDLGETITSLVEAGSVTVTPYVTGIVWFGMDEASPVSGVQVVISDTLLSSVYSITTKEDGFYRHLMPVPSVRLQASKSSTSLDKEAIDISDILLLLRSIVKLDTLSSYTSFIADVNFNQTVNVQDAVFLHRIIAGLDEDLPNGLWHIMPSQQKAMLPLTNYEKRFTIQDGDTSDVNFHAHLMGDINGSWASLQKAAKSVAQPLVQWAQDKEETVIMVENQSFLEFSLSDIQESVYGYQLELIFPNDVQVSIASQPEGSFLSSQKVYDTQHMLLKMVWYNLEHGLEESLSLIQFQIESSRSEFPIQLARKTTFVNLKGEPVQARLVISYNGEEQTVTSTETTTLPSKTELKETYPNPFNPSTTIRYSLAKSEKVSLSVYSVLGQLVAEIPIGLKPAGEHTFLLKGEQWSSGIYLLNLKAGSYQATKPITLIK